jgi:hypothetical protein
MTRCIDGSLRSGVESVDSWLHPDARDLAALSAVFDARVRLVNGGGWQRDAWLRWLLWIKAIKEELIGRRFF